MKTLLLLSQAGGWQRVSIAQEGPGSERTAKTLLFLGKGGLEPAHWVLGPAPPVISSVTLGKSFALSEPYQASVSLSGQWRQHLLYSSVGKVRTQHLACSWCLINASLSCFCSPGAEP